MAQIIPSITSLPSDSSAAPSVEDIQDRLPSICVDYLSHDWSEEDVWASWRNMTRHKHEIANGVRLENASWRTWQKQRNKLKTISPETLNWLKDSDVTWLYGPLHTAHVEPVRPLKVASTDERLGIDRPNPALPKTKPILKHRTLSEMLTIPMPSSPILESSYQEDDIDSLDGDHANPPRPHLMQTKSDTNIFRSRTGPVRRKSPPRVPSSSGKQTPKQGEDVDMQPDSAASATQSSNKRHISFNTFVEQCVAVDDPTENHHVDQDSDDEMLEMRSSSSRGSSRPSLSRHSSSGSGEHLTIAMIAPTVLKTPGGHQGSLPQMIYAPPPEYLSPGQHPAASQFDFPSPSVEGRQRWQGDEDEEYGSVGFDYFGGPDLAGEDKQAGKQIQTHVGASYGRAPTVGQPPAQPKWRSAQPASVESSTSPSSSSSSGSLNQIISPQQTKGILKVRQASTTPPAEPSSPPNSYFNYNPSAATGIGGMRGAQYLDQPGPSGSPVVSPVITTEERGRSTSRERGRDRSLSRGTSSSTNSISPGAPSSPVGPTRRPAQVTQAPQTVAAPQLDKVEEDASWAEAEPMDEDYVPERSSTPTPHSSPQITFRPLKDTSPASLPHTSTRTPSSGSTSSYFPKTSPSASASAPTSVTSPRTPSHELPKADSPITVSASASGSGSKATIAHVGTNAQPTLSWQAPTSAQNQTQHMADQNPQTQAPTAPSYFQNQGQNQGQAAQVANGSPGDLDLDDEDGSSIMGRAANIASTAKDLLGALWYGANDDPRARQGRVHKRGASLG